MTRHNLWCKRTMHGMTGTRLHNIWCDIHKRCNNKNSPRYKDYGGRGIVFCEEWKEFMPFHTWAMANGYRDDLTIERKDNDGNYSPENCTWITRIDQAKNKRETRYVEIDGESLTLRELSKKVNIPYVLLNKRWWKGDRGQRLIRPIDSPPLVEYEGKTQTLREWAEEKHINLFTFYHRYRRGERGERLMRPAIWTRREGKL